MSEIKEQDWQYNKIRFGRDNMVRNKVNAPTDSVNPVTGNIGVKLAPEVDKGNSFTKTMLSVGSAFNGYTNGAFSIDSEGNIVARENPYLEHFITFKNVNGKNATAHKFKDFDSLETQLKNLQGTDSTGPFSSTAMEGAALGITASKGKLGSLATGGIVAALIGMTRGPKDPLTGDPTAQLVPMLSNAILKHKYDAIKKIRTAIKNGDSDVGDAVKLGGFSFVREPGKYYFNGNLSAVGLSHEELHGLSAIARGFDPNSYNYKTGEGTRILTYGGTAGYMLDGRHVDYMGRIAGAGIGTMRSDTWRAMVMKHFNGNNDIAQQWLTGTEQFRGFSGIKDAEAAQAWFNQMTGNANGTNQFDMYDGIGQTPLTDVNATAAMQGAALGIPAWQQNMLDQGITNLNGSKFMSRWNIDNIKEITADYQSAFTNKYEGGTEEEMGTETESPVTAGFTDFMESNIGFQTYEGGLEEEMGTESPNVYGNFGASTTDFMGGNVIPADFSTGFSDFMGGNVNPLTREQIDESTIKRLFPDEDNINITYYSSIATENPILMEGMAHKYKSHVSNSWKNVGTEKTESDSMFRNIANMATIATTSGEEKEERTDTTSFSSPSDLGAASEISKSINDSSLDDKISAATQAVSYTPTFRTADNDRGFIGGFKAGGMLGYQEGDMIQDPSQAPQVVGGQMPSQVPEQQTVADNVQDSLKEGTFVLNAPAVELAGESDVKNMVMNAFYSARERGLPIGGADNKLYEKNIDVLLSKGEVTIPPELVKIIGLSKLRKLNNRGLREVEKRDAQAKQSQQASFPSKMEGMPQLKEGDKVSDNMQLASDKLDEAFGRKPVSSNEEVYSNMLNNEEMGAVFGSNFTLKEADPMAIRDGETEIEYKKRVGIIRDDSPRSDSEDDMVQSAGFLTQPVAGQPEIDLGLQGAMSEQYVKFADALTKAEWGGEHDTEETRSENYFLRTMEAPKQGSSAYGPLQITGGLLASNFGNIDHLTTMRDSKQSIVKGPSKLMIENYNKGAEGALRDRLSDTEKEFVDALIDQANLFLIYGKEPNRKGYDQKFDYGGKGNIQEVFPENYKQLYNSIGMKLIQSLSETVDGDPVEFAKLWKSGDDPKKPFKDNRYLEQFTGNLEGFDEYLDTKFDGKVLPIPSPMRQ